MYEFCGAPALGFWPNGEYDLGGPLAAGAAGAAGSAGAAACAV
eukprot:CAMPEP_0185725374 /NCGR_PEP_ID=MMETSP1171-20130828/1651_1 /TAXON_ID=374046 /ORGANISM="Helicotheca tamensis, Strain CCMP826" /LENGTH=42 /DNA_ID= /DNA_START= /DNA_END= /DNA_ORIENTATION=